jgi:hypothetical protein
MSFAHSATIATLTRYHSNAKQQQQYGGIIATLTRYHSNAKQQQQYGGPFPLFCQNPCYHTFRNKRKKFNLCYIIMR